MCSDVKVGCGSGLEGKSCFEIFSCIMINSVKSMEKIVISHVDVSSCGIPLREDLASNL